MQQAIFTVDPNMQTEHLLGCFQSYILNMNHTVCV